MGLIVDARGRSVVVSSGGGQCELSPDKPLGILRCPLTVQARIEPGCPAECSDCREGGRLIIQAVEMPELQFTRVININSPRYPSVSFFFDGFRAVLPGEPAYFVTHDAVVSLLLSSTFAEGWSQEAVPCTLMGMVEGSVDHSNIALTGWWSAR